MPSVTRWPTGCPVTSPTDAWTRPSSPPAWAGPPGPSPGADLDGLFDDLPRLADEPAPRRARRSRLVPMVLVSVLVIMAVDSAWSLVTIPWLLVVLVGLLSGAVGAEDATRTAPSGPGH